MVDFHCHVLPGIDDGSPDLKTTQRMLRELSRQGVSVVAATPHFYATKDHPEAFLARRDAALEKVAALQMPQPVIIPGAEVAYFDGMGQSEKLTCLQLADSGMILIEMPFCTWTKRMAQEILDLQRNTGLTPVLAHVNRYRRRDQLPQFAEQLLSSGVLFQCNAEAFLSLFEMKWALKQLDSGCIHFIGSDAHNLVTRPPKLRQAVQVIERKCGADILKNLDAVAYQMLKIEK